MMDCLLLINQQMRLKLSILTGNKDAEFYYELNVDELDGSNDSLDVGR